MSLLTMSLEDRVNNVFQQLQGEEEEEEEVEEEGRNGEGAPLQKEDLGFDDPFFQHDVTSATAVSVY